MSSGSFVSWCLLPAELRLAVVDHVDHDALLSLSTASRAMRALCVPRLFKSVTIACYPALLSFLACVPWPYLEHVRELDIRTSDTSSPTRQPFPPGAADVGTDTPKSDALVRLLSGTPLLERLALHLSGGLAPKTVSCFESLAYLTELAVENCEDEDVSPLSEQVVVSIALALPKLASLSLTRITRSLHYAEDITSSTPYSSITSIPLVFNDFPVSTDRPLSLPTLLTIPTLRHLAIHDTHLSDARFTSPDLRVCCALEDLEIGVYAGCAPAETASWTARILARVAPQVTRLSCGAGLPDMPPGALLLPRLSHVRFTPYMSPSMIAPTLSCLATAGCPVQGLDVECMHEDTEDVVDELLAFVNDAAAANSCPFDNVRLLVKEDSTPSTSLPPAKAVELDVECSRSVHKLEGACDRAGVNVSLLGAELSPTVVTEPGQDIDRDDVMMVEDDGDELNKTVLQKTFSVDVQMLEEDTWARLEGW